jgi:hypothetical protein
MPIGDGRTTPFPGASPRPKRKLGKRDAPPADTDGLLNELREESVRAVARVLALGGSIQFGSTRDRTSMLVRAWVAGDVYEDYVTSVGEYMATLEALEDVCNGAEARRPSRLTNPA